MNCKRKSPVNLDIAQMFNIPTRPSYSKLEISPINAVNVAYQICRHYEREEIIGY